MRKMHKGGRCGRCERKVAMRYRKKPVEVDAWQYRGDIPDTAPLWVRAAVHYDVIFRAGAFNQLFIKSLEGTHHVSEGDYIIQGVKGELYACKPDIFHMTYEAVDGEKDDVWRAEVTE